ncbi:hypothetical protein MNBD_NITROSPIRAE01-1414 [hydrothermal vent metagenome]|uniref:Iron-binding zinc finger CDGSH type domain-containing protein n=1 Tax=hydrothermal vent metagenome TaxID=652676 RepID=A0A3B1D3X0_9ZZZZ
MSERKQPYVISEEPGDKYYCACGKSENQPYCDGAHERLNTGKTPTHVVIEKKKSVAWCGCRKSENMPFCDGTHTRL